MVKTLFTILFLCVISLLTSQFVSTLVDATTVSATFSGTLCVRRVALTLATDSASLRAYPGQTTQTDLIIKNLNDSTCPPNTYLISRSTVTGIGMNIANYVEINPGESKVIPVELTTASNLKPGNYLFQIWVYNSWDDGSGQSIIDGYLEVLPTSTPIPANMVLVSGKITSTTGSAVAQTIGKKLEIEICQPLTTPKPVTDSKGNFSFLIQKGKTFCVRGPNLSTYGFTKKTAVNRTRTSESLTSYEWQVAGFDCAGVDKTRSNCQYNDKIRNDKSTDIEYNIQYLN